MTSNARMKVLRNNLKRFKVVTFDCTNTLLYFKCPPELQYLKTAVSLGVPGEQFDKNLMKVNFGKQFKNLRQKYPNFGRDSINYQTWYTKLVVNVFTESSREPIDPKLLEAVASKLIDQYKTKECWGKFEKSNELIAALKDAGKIVGVISNTDPRIHHLLGDMDLPKFDFIVTSYEAGVEKPDPKIFDYVRSLLNKDVLPSEALHIGNEEKTDFDGARNANWSAVLINTKTEIKPCFKDIQEFWDVLTTDNIEL